MNRTEGKENGRAGNMTLWAFLVLVPLLAYSLIWIFTGTAPWNIDAWNSDWNDELGYLRGVRLMRTYLRPRGVIGYNEVLNHHLSYGPYTPFTYLIYAAFSFITGYTSHNFMYLCNLLMALAANLIFVLLVKPDRKQSLWMFLTFFFNLVWLRYAWSGMVEESYSFYMVIFTGLVLYENRPQKECAHSMAGIIAMTGLTSYFSLMRPYYVLLLIFPLYYFVRLMKRRQGTAGKTQRALMAAGVSALLVLIPVLLYTFVYMRNNYVAIYFSSSTNTVENFTNMLSGGNLTESIRTIWNGNVRAVRYMRDHADHLSFCLTVFITDVMEWVLLIILIIRAVREQKKDRDKIFTLVIFLLFSLAVYEATVVFYNPMYVHRMTGASALAAGLVIAYYGNISRPVLISLSMVMACIAGITYPASIRMPEKSERSLTGAEAGEMTAEYEKIMPCDESGDPWKNTVARPVMSTNDFGALYTLPDYLGMNIFERDVLTNAISTGTLRSRYLMISRGKNSKKLRELAESKYKVIGTCGNVEIMQVW